MKEDPNSPTNPIYFVSTPRDIWSSQVEVQNFVFFQMTLFGTLPDHKILHGRDFLWKQTTSKVTTELCAMVTMVTDSAYDYDIMGHNSCRFRACLHVVKQT